MAYEHIDWCLSEVVDPKYIAAVCTLIENNYPQRESKSSKPPIQHKEDIFAPSPRRILE